MIRRTKVPKGYLFFRCFYKVMKDHRKNGWKGVLSFNKEDLKQYPNIELSQDQLYSKYGRGEEPHHWFVYLLIKNDVVQYIGQTEWICNRLRNHCSDKSFDTVALKIVSNKEKALQLEKDLICAFSNLFNYK